MILKNDDSTATLNPFWKQYSCLSDGLNDHQLLDPTFVLWRRSETFVRCLVNAAICNQYLGSDFSQWIEQILPKTRRQSRDCVVSIVDTGSSDDLQLFNMFRDAAQSTRLSSMFRKEYKCVTIDDLCEFIGPYYHFACPLTSWMLWSKTQNWGRMTTRDHRQWMKKSLRPASRQRLASSLLEFTNLHFK
jgi:hypothetical protein